MVFKVDSTCSKCGKSGAGPGKVWSVRMGPPVVCYICEPPPLEGACPTCEGFGTVDVFHAWFNLNQVIHDTGSRLDVLRERLPACRTKVAARTVLENSRLLEIYPLLPDWLPEA